MDNIEDTQSKVDDLEAGHAENKAKLDKVTAATFDWSSFLSTPIGKAVGGLLIVMLMQLTAWVTTAMNQPAVVPVPPVVVVTPDGVKPSPIVPPQQSKAAIKLFLTVESKGMANDLSLKGLPISLDPVSYLAGSTYPFGGTDVPLPCAEIHGKDGAIVSVTPITSAADILAAWKKVQP